MNLARIYRAALHAQSGIPYALFRGGRAFPPVHYYLEVTRRCNLRCQMCQYIQWLRTASAEEQKAGELTTEEWQTVIDQTNRFGLLTFTGGEPWVRPDFEDLLQYASSKRVTHFISNGVLINEDRARHCVELGFRRTRLAGLAGIGISIDAPGERHDQIRNQAGAFAKATAAARTISEHKRKLGQRWPSMHITSVVQAANLDVLPEMPRVARELGADVLNLTIEIRTPDLKDLGVKAPQDLDPSSLDRPRLEADALTAALEATRLAAKEAGIGFRMPRMPLSEVVRYYTGSMTLSQYQCRVPWTTLTIGRTGDVYPCMIVKAGNIRETPLSAIWNGPVMRAFRRGCRRGLPQVCEGCCELEYAGPTIEDAGHVSD